MPDATIFTTPYHNYDGTTRNLDTSVPERIIDSITFDSISSHWESLSNAAATTTYAPYELGSFLQPNGQGWQAFADASTMNIEGISDAITGNPITLNRLDRNQRAQLVMTADNLSEYLFDILDSRYGVNDTESTEPKASPFPKEKLLEVLLAE